MKTFLQLTFEALAKPLQAPVSVFGFQVFRMHNILRASKIPSDTRNLTPVYSTSKKGFASGSFCFDNTRGSCKAFKVDTEVDPPVNKQACSADSRRGQLFPALLKSGFCKNLTSMHSIKVWSLALFLIIGPGMPQATRALVASSAGRPLSLDSTHWSPRPTWLPNPADQFTLQTVDEGMVFGVANPLKGMKWLLDTELIELRETPWLVVRYRAENMPTTGEDYVLSADDGVPGRSVSPVRFSDIKADGKWRLLAVDVGELTDAMVVSALAVQVQADAHGAASLQIDRLEWKRKPPTNAELLRHTEPEAKQPDWVSPLQSADWQPEPTWLHNPAAKHRHHVEIEADQNLFRVETAGKGMKWHWAFPDPLDLAGRRYLVLRYRAEGVAPTGDYALSLLGVPLATDSPVAVTAFGASEFIADGRWRTLHLDTRWLASQYRRIDGFAIQVQAAAPDAHLEIAAITLTNTEQYAPLSDLLDWRSGSAEEAFTPVVLDDVVHEARSAWLERFRLHEWFDSPQIVVEHIPFTVRTEDPALAATALRVEAELRIPVSGVATEVYLLLFAALSGFDEPVYGGGTFRAIRDVDRFRVRLEYEEGPPDECLPLNLSTGGFGLVAGPQLLVAAADDNRLLQAVVLIDRSPQAAHALAGVTLRTDGQRGHPAALEADAHPLRLPQREENGPQPAARLEVQWAVSGAPHLSQLIHQPSGWKLLSEPSSLLALWVDHEPVPLSDLVALTTELPVALTSPNWTWFRVPDRPGLKLGLAVSYSHDAELRVAAKVHNAGPQMYTVKLVAPTVGPFRLSAHAEDDYYLFPRRGTVLDHSDRSLRERYSGDFPVQFVDTFAPSAGRGLALRTEDREALRKYYLLDKEDGQFVLGVEYPDRPLAPGESLITAPTVIAANHGDGRQGFADYRRWLQQWHEPIKPRQDWFRQVFNFRQRYLWEFDPVYDAVAERFRLDEALAADRRDFGGVDYLHLFDWGNLPGTGRVYGRDGDLDPFVAIAGGRDTLATAIRGVQADGVPVGLYIEGYLLEERGLLGAEHGQQWQLIDAAGRPRYWADTSEMFICPVVSPWIDIQASTVARKIKQLNADGMYLDQFGFTSHEWDCFAPDHGHPVASYAVTAEQPLIRTVRAAMADVNPRAVLYSEETPVDVTTPYQDGSFTYALYEAQRTSTLVPLNMARFAFPDFKTFEILFCDAPTGSWATGVRWVFFNGEALWLQGPAQQWFAPGTLAEIRRCHALLTTYRDAFTSLEPEPLVATEMGGVFANRFPTASKTVYTLLNTRHRTLRGPMLRLPHDPTATYHDAWHDRPAHVTRAGDWDLIATELGPHGVGCIVVKSPDTTP